MLPLQMTAVFCQLSAPKDEVKRGFEVYGLGFRVKGLGFRVKGLGFGI